MKSRQRARQARLCWRVAFFYLLVMGGIFLVGASNAAAADADAEAVEREKHYMSDGIQAEDFIQEKIKTHDVMVFARSYGPHNAEAKKILQEMQKEINVHVEVVDVDLLPGFDPSLIMVALQELTGQWAFPNIFIGQKHIGGNSELEQLSALGELHQMVLQATSRSEL